MRLALIALGILVSTPALAADAVVINLICPGSASRDESNSSVGIVGGSAAFVTSEQKVNFDESVGFRINPDNTGEGRIPKKIRPMFQSGNNGWFPLINVQRSADEITGQIRFHSMYKPRFRLDRITGRVILNGDLGDFSGQCQAYDPATVERKF